jgi:hypothetical protein
MTRDDFNRYIADLQQRQPLGFFLSRSFRTAEDWNRWSSHDFRSVASRGEGQPQLGNVLYHRRAVIVGEAGCGKSALARKAVEIAAAHPFIPIFVPLTEYTGNLEALVQGQAPESVLRARDVDGAPTSRLYIFDGFDEIPASHSERFLREFNDLARNEPDSRILLTSRQAFFAGQSSRFAQPVEVFHILDLSDEDVDAFIEHAGLDRGAFRTAASRSHLSQELGNPLALDALLQLFRRTGGLGETRSDAMQHVVDSALATRPTSDPRRQKRALRMLAIAMEVAARNQLTDDEAQAVLQRALRVDAAASRTLLDELTQSVLVRTPTGYTFQLHSYGEYLAAEELSEILETDRILRLMYLEGTVRPSDSWRNCVSYLVERHRGVRTRFSRRFPDWTLTSSPAVFNERDRTSIVGELLGSLARQGAYLLQHPTIRAGNLARFVSEAMLPELRTAVESTNDVEAANAALLVAACRDRTMSDRLLDIALDPNRSPHVRQSVLAAYDQIGIPQSVQRLLDIQDWDDATTLSRVDAAAGLMDATNASEVLAALARTDAMVSSAFYRFSELNDPADLEAVLDALIGLPRDTLLASRLSYYMDRFWSALVRRWRPELADKVAQVVLRFEDAGNPDDGDLCRHFVVAMQSLPDRGQSVGRLILERLLTAGLDIHHLYRAIPALVSPDDAGWLAAQPASDRLVRTVRAFGPRETVAVLRGPITPEQQEQIDRWQQEERQRQERTARIERTIVTSEDANTLFRALTSTDPARWPEVSPARRAWLAHFVGERLVRLDLQRHIRWQSETQLTQPGILPVLLALVRRYELQIADDEPLAWALLSETNPTRTYQQRFGLSDRAISVIELLLEAPDTPNPGIDQVLRFVGDADIRTPRILGALERIATDAARPNRIREGAVRIVAGTRDSDALLRISPTLPPELQRETEDLLVEAQHRGTIERRLQHLLNDAAALTSGEIDVHFNHPLNWVGKIREPALWDTLVRLRRLSLQRGLDRVAGIFTNTLAEIDMMRAAQVIQRQMNDAPAAWRPYLRRRALEMERDATIRAAQGVAFEGVLRRLEDATTLNRFKIWAEGPTDCPPLEEMAHKVTGAETINIVAQSLGGWGTILSPQWSPQHLGDGCHDFMVVLDGDGAYDYSRPGLIEKRDVRPFLARLRAERVPFRVLDRYGLENYFPRRAFETVLGRDLSPHFPLDSRGPVIRQIPGYHKNMNAELARLTTMADLAGTDLGDVLQEIARLAGA